MFYLRYTKVHTLHFITIGMKYERKQKQHNYSSLVKSWNKPVDLTSTRFWCALLAHFKCYPVSASERKCRIFSEFIWNILDTERKCWRPNQNIFEPHLSFANKLNQDWSSSRSCCLKWKKKQHLLLLLEYAIVYTFCFFKNYNECNTHIALVDKYAMCKYLNQIIIFCICLNFGDFEKKLLTLNWMCLS